MLKKLFIFMMLFAWIPFTSVQANVRDPENLRVNEFTFTIQNEPGEDHTIFISEIQTPTGRNTLVNSQGSRADYVQVFWPYHPNLGLEVYPANDGFNAQASIIYFDTGGTVGTPFQFRFLFSNDTVNSSIRRTNGGFSTVIQVPRNSNGFWIQVNANTDNHTTVDEIKELLDNNFTVQSVANPNTISYPFNDFELDTDDGIFIVSSNNPIPSSAVRELIVYINNFYERFSDVNDDSYIVFKNSNGVTLQTLNLTNGLWYNEIIYADIDGYYHFNLNTTTLIDAASFNLYIAVSDTTNINNLLPFMTDSMYYNFDDQIHDVYYYSNLQLIDKRPFSIYAYDLEQTILPQLHDYWYWINPETNEQEAYNFNNIPNQDIYLYSQLTTSIILNPTLPDDIGGVNNPLDTILINTGFYNAGGLMLIYLIIIIGVVILVWKYQLSTMIAIVINILITAIFMFLGYMPLFASILLITFYIVAVIGINKGGLFSE